MARKRQVELAIQTPGPSGPSFHFTNVSPSGIGTMAGVNRRTPSPRQSPAAFAAATRRASAILRGAETTTADASSAGHLGVGGALRREKWRQWKKQYKIRQRARGAAVSSSSSSSSSEEIDLHDAAGGADPRARRSGSSDGSTFVFPSTKRATPEQRRRKMLFLAAVLSSLTFSAATVLIVVGMNWRLLQVAGAIVLVPAVGVPLCGVVSVKHRQRRCACAFWLLTMLLAVVCGFGATLLFFTANAFNGVDCSTHCRHAAQMPDAIATCEERCKKVQRGAVPLIVAATCAMVSAVGYCYSGFTLNYLHYHDRGFFVIGDYDDSHDPGDVAGSTAHGDLEQQHEVALS